MNTIKTWIACAVIASGTALCGACSDDDGKDDSAAGAGAGTNGGAGASGASGSSGSGGPAADPNEPAAPGVPPTFIPTFPGSGTSGDDAPLTNGELCDYVPLNGAPTPNEITTCFFEDGDPLPAATMEQVLECVDGADVVHIRLTFHPTFVDNTYGANAIGWGAEDAADDPMMMEPPMMMGGKPRKPARGRNRNYEQLVGSDHAEIVLKDESGATVMQFKLDYISEDAAAPSGYASLGVLGGDGEMIVGDAAWLLDYQTSIETNLNDRGYGSYIVDSPATDADYTPNPETPEWDYRYVFEAWIDVDAFGAAGFGKALIESVHASPSKADSNTLIVEPGECPCKDQPDIYCTPGDDDPPPDEPPPDEPPPDEVCDPSQPDIECDASVPDASVCMENPDDPFCAPI
jgi:hypothetical protein